MPNMYLVNTQHGAEDVEKAAVPLIVAGAAAAMDSETAVFFTGEAVRLATRGGADGAAIDGYPALSELMTALTENGARLWVCPVCANARGIGPEDLIAGAEIAGAARTIGFMNDGAQLLM